MKALPLAKIFLCFSTFVRVQVRSRFYLLETKDGKDDDKDYNKMKNEVQSKLPLLETKNGKDYDFADSFSDAWNVKNLRKFNSEEKGNEDFKIKTNGVEKDGDSMLDGIILIFN